MRRRRGVHLSLKPDFISHAVEGTQNGFQGSKSGQLQQLSKAIPTRIIIGYYLGPTTPLCLLAVASGAENSIIVSANREHAKFLSVTQIRTRESYPCEHSYDIHYVQKGQKQVTDGDQSYSDRTIPQLITACTHARIFRIHKAHKMY